LLCGQTVQALVPNGREVLTAPFPWLAFSAERFHTEEGSVKGLLAAVSAAAVATTTLAAGGLPTAFAHESTPVEQTAGIK
jgi:hypothetical protein